MEVVQVLLLKRYSPLSECTSCSQQGRVISAVKRCSNKIIQFLTGGAY